MVPDSVRAETHLPALPVTVLTRVFNIEALVSGDKVAITLHSKSLGFISVETDYIGYVRCIDVKRRTVELSPFKSKFLRDLLPASVTVDAKNFSAKGLLWQYEIRGGEGSFEKYATVQQELLAP